MKNIIDMTAKFLKGDSHSAADIGDQKRAVNYRLAEIEKRLAFLRSRGIADARETGDHATVTGLVQEQKDLESEERTLLARRGRLHVEYKAAQTAEMVKDAKRIKAGISEQAGKVESMQAQLDDAKASLNRSVDTLRQAAQHDNSDALKLDRQTAERIALIKFGSSPNNEVVDSRKRFVNEVAMKAPAKKPRPAGEQEHAGVVA